MSFLNRLAHFSIVFSRYPVGIYSRIICIFILSILISSPICGEPSCLADGGMLNYGTSLLNNSSNYPDPITTATPRRVQLQQPTKDPINDVVTATPDALLSPYHYGAHDYRHISTTFGDINVHNVWQYYYQNKTAYHELKQIKLRYDPIDLFHTTFTAPLPNHNEPDCLAADGDECDAVSDSVAAPTVCLATQISSARGDYTNSAAVEIFMEIITQNARIRIGRQDYIVFIVAATAESSSDKCYNNNGSSIESGTHARFVGSNTTRGVFCESSLVAQVARTHFDENIYAHFDDHIYHCGALSGLAVTTAPMAPFTRTHFDDNISKNCALSGSTEATSMAPQAHTHFEATSSIAPQKIFGEHFDDICATFKSYGNVQGLHVASSLFICFNNNKAIGFVVC